VTINIISRSDKGIVIASDSYRTKEGRHSSNRTKQFILGPLCSSTICGRDGFISRSAAKEDSPQFDTRFSDLHKAFEQESNPNEHLAPQEIAEKLREVSRSHVALGKTSQALREVLLQTGRSNKGEPLDLMMAGYTPDGDFDLIGMNFPKGNTHRLNPLKENDFFVDGSGIDSINRLYLVLTNRQAKKKLVDLIKTKVQDEELKKGFLRLIKRFSQRTAVSFIYDHKLETQEKYFRLLTKLAIFLDRNARAIVKTANIPITIGGKVTSSSFNMNKPLLS
jgi:hypothetical protein